MNRMEHAARHPNRRSVQTKATTGISANVMAAYTHVWLAGVSASKGMNAADSANAINTCATFMPRTLPESKE